jgi:hypothetical protein
MDYPRATVSRILVRLKLHKARHLEPTVPIVREERPAPGDLLPIDIKKPVRIKKPGHRITDIRGTRLRCRLGVPLRRSRRSLAYGLHRHDAG